MLQCVFLGGGGFQTTAPWKRTDWWRLLSRGNYIFFFAQTHHSLAFALTTEEVADVSVDWVQIKRPLRGASSCVSGRLPVSVSLTWGELIKWHTVRMLTLKTPLSSFYGSCFALCVRATVRAICDSQSTVERVWQLCAARLRNPRVKNTCSAGKTTAFCACSTSRTAKLINLQHDILS